MNDKEKQVERYRRGAHHWIGYEEGKRRAEEARRRRSERAERAPRRRDWADIEEEDEEAAIESMAREKPRPGGARSARAAAGGDPLPEIEGADRLPAGARLGLVVAVRGRDLLLTIGGAQRAAASVAGLVVGDQVAVEERGAGLGRVVGLVPRRSALARVDPARPARSQTLAANVDLGWIALPIGPGRVKSGLVDRVALALERSGVRPVVVFTKADLARDAGRADLLAELVATYRDAGFEAHAVSVLERSGLDGLRAAVAGATSVVIGHSGAGKSSLLNALDPEGARAVGEVRRADGKGRHTTTCSELRELEDGTRLIDTPGVRTFGLEPLEGAQLRALFSDLVGRAGACAFADCRHAGDAGCAVERAAAEDARLASRWRAYRRILASLEPGVE